jgi:pyrimidine-nucleoside phosphorylase
VRVTEILATKRDGRPNSPEEIAYLLNGYVRNEIPDYQVSAWLMAACIRGLSGEETLALTREMAASGRTLDLSSLPEPRVDKHSTGGVGDKTSLVLVPLLAACGCTVVKMSGRGLGITGGTIDKLESIPGFRTQLSPEEMVRVARRVGCCIAGQTANLAPADGLLYSLRDVTATVESIPLIVASIMSKKLAVGADVISLDVKCGSGSFMRTPERAGELARSLVRVGVDTGKRMAATITDMSAPLGYGVGNALEVAEAIETLSGTGPRRLVELCLALAAETLVAAGVSGGRDEARALAERKLAGGEARKRLAAMLEAQGADPSVLDHPSRLREVYSPVEVHADRDGYVEVIDAGVVGSVALELGAGRQTKEDAVDHAVGIRFAVEIGDAVAAGQPIALVYARTPAEAETAAHRLSEAVTYSDAPPSIPPIVLERVVL